MGALMSPGPDAAVEWLVAAGTFLMVAVFLGALGLVRGSAVAGTRYHRRFTGNVKRRLNDLLLFVDAQRLFKWNLLLGVAVTVAIWLLTGSWLLVGIGLLIVGMLPNLLLLRLSKRRRRRFAEQLPDALMLVAGAIRAGASLPLALRQMSFEVPPPCGQEFDLMLREQQLGVSLDQALGSLERRMAGDDLRLFTAAVRIAGDSGGDLAETLERLADTIRRKLTLEGKIRSLTAQGRLQGWIMSLLPLAVAAALFVIEPEAMELLIATWQGWVVCAVIAVLEFAGMVLIRRIMDIDI